MFYIKKNLIYKNRGKSMRFKKNEFSSFLNFFQLFPKTKSVT